MAVWRDGVSLTVEIAFATAPQATPTWVDVTDYVRDVPNVFRGRTDEYASFSPGSATVVLDNRDRRFDPDYAAGAYYPNVLPGKRIKITWAFAAASGVLFTGYVQGWPQHETPPSDAWVVLQCVDGTRLLEQATLPGSAYAAEVLSDSPFAYWPLQAVDSSGSSIAVVGTDLSVRPVYSFGGTDDPLDVVDIGYPFGQTLSVSGGGAEASLTVASFPRTLELWTLPADDSTFDVVVSRTSTEYLRVNWTGTSDPDVRLAVSYSGDVSGSTERTLATLGYGSLTVVAGMPLSVSHIAVVAAATSFEVYINGVLFDTVAYDPGVTYTNILGLIPGTYISVTEGSSSISHIAAYTTALSAATIQTHYAAGVGAYSDPSELGGARIGRALDSAGWPSGLRDLDTGGTPQAAYLPASQTAMSYLRDVELSEHGMVFLDASGDVRFIDRQTIWKAANTATLSDDGAAGAIKYVDAVRGSSIDTIRNIVDVTYVDGSVTRKDATSVTAYSEVRESIACPTMPTAELAASLADYVVREKATPGIVVSSLVAPLRVSGGDNEAETLLALEVGDRVTWERTPVGVSPQVVKTLIVQGLSHSISRDQWLVSLYLSPMPTSYIDAPYLTVADSTYGKIGVTAGNLIPF